MKVAVAVLAASLLFFVGVLTGDGRRPAVPAPGTITLGVVQPSSPSDAPRSSPAVPAPTKGATTTRPSAAPTQSPSNPSGAAGTGNPANPPGAPAAGPPAPGPTGTTATTAPAAATTSSTTVPPGQVQQVDNQVDCAPAGKKGRGHPSPCPSTTTSTSATPTGDGTGGRSRP